MNQYECSPSPEYAEGGQTVEIGDRLKLSALLATVWCRSTYVKRSAQARSVLDWIEAVRLDEVQHVRDQGSDRRVHALLDNLFGGLLGGH